MNGFSKYYQKDRQTRLDILVQQKKLTQAEVDSLIAPKLDLTPVSYTHLTLPTNREV